jgi:phosphoribosylformylglycinamidine cyclo-ligase
MMYDTTKPYKVQIQQAIRSTWETPYAKAFVVKGSPYPFVERKNRVLWPAGHRRPVISRIEVDHTDGIGTKGSIHAMARTWEYAVQDALAMNLNDLLVVRARPYKLQNHLTIQHDDHEAILAVVSALAGECMGRSIILTGGETSIHDNIVGMDLSITVTGFVPEVRQNEFRIGDVLIGLPSTGAHANGFTFIRKTLGGRRDMVTPTKIYWDEVYPVVNSTEYEDDIHGMVHIAGGGFTRLLDYADIGTIHLRKWKNRPAIFGEIYDYCQQKTFGGEADNKLMYSTFNCGIGFILAVSRDKSEELATILKGEIIGEVTDGASRVEIESIFDNNLLEF